MPRSHSMTFMLPPARMYSADSSHSSIVAEMPRFSRTGVRAWPSSRSSVKFCMLRAPTWRMSRVPLDQLELADVHHLRDELEVVPVGRAAQHLEAFFTETLEAVRRAARLERAAAQDLGAGILDGRRRRLDLFLGLGGARSGHDDDFVAADPQVADRDDGVLGPETPAGELVGLGDAVHLLDAVHAPRSARDRTAGCRPPRRSPSSSAPVERCTSNPISTSCAITRWTCSSFARSFITTTIRSSHLFHSSATAPMDDRLPCEPARRCDRLSLLLPQSVRAAAPRR